MRKKLRSNNIVTVEGVKKHKRWTILDVDDEVVEIVKSTASKEGFTVSTALKKLVKQGVEYGKWRKEEEN